jgi:hypothetical protein
MLMALPSPMCWTLVCGTKICHQQDARTLPKQIAESSPIC